MARRLLVMFVSGWGPQFAPGLFAESMGHYPVALVKSTPVGAYQRYESFGSLAQTQALARRLQQSGIADVRIADPDRFGALVEAFDGGEKIVSHVRQDILIPFPPGPTLADGTASTVRLQKKAVVNALQQPRDQVVFVAWGALWTASLYQNEEGGRETALTLAADAQKIVDEALEQEYIVVVCGDDPRGEVLPVMLIHPALEGLRSSSQDVSDERAFPARPEGGIEQFAPTMAALLQLPRQEGEPRPLFGHLLSRLVS